MTCPSLWATSAPCWGGVLPRLDSLGAQISALSKRLEAFEESKTQVIWSDDGGEWWPSVYRKLSEFTKFTIKHHLPSTGGNRTTTISASVSQTVSGVEWQIKDYGSYMQFHGNEISSDSGVIIYEIVGQLR